MIIRPLTALENYLASVPELVDPDELDEPDKYIGRLMRAHGVNAAKYRFIDGNWFHEYGVYDLDSCDLIVKFVVREGLPLREDDNETE